MSGDQAGLQTSLTSTSPRSRQIAHGVGHLLDDDRSQGAAERGEGHGDQDVAAVGDVDVVDEPEIDDIDADLRIEDVLQIIACLFGGKFSHR